MYKSRDSHIAYPLIMHSLTLPPTPIHYERYYCTWLAGFRPSQFALERVSDTSIQTPREPEVHTHATHCPPCWILRAHQIWLCQGPARFIREFEVRLQRLIELSPSHSQAQHCLSCLKLGRINVVSSWSNAVGRNCARVRMARLFMQSPAKA